MFKRILLAGLFSGAVLFHVPNAAAQPAAGLPGGEAVVFHQDTLFYLYAGHRIMTVSERVRLLEGRLQDISADPKYSPDSLSIEQDADYSELLYKGTVLMAVNDSDALYNDASRLALARTYEQRIREALSTQTAFSWGGLASIVLQMLLVLGILALLILLVGKGHRWLQRKILKDVRWQGLSIRSYQVLSRRQLVDISERLLHLLRWVVILLLFYLSLPLLFSFLPSTRTLAGQLIAYTLNPLKAVLLGILHFIPNLLTIVVIFICTRYLIRMIGFFAGEVEKGNLRIGNFYPDWAQPTFKLIKVLLYVFMFIVIYPYLPGSQSKIFQGVSVFLGVLISLGSSSAIANLVAGIVLTYMRPFKIGDRVRIGEVTGDVVEKNMLVTRIRTIKNEDITVPNASVLSGHSINYSARTEQDSPGLVLHTTVTIGYDTPYLQVEELLIRAACRTEGLLTNPAPYVLQLSLDDFYVSYEINAYTRNASDMANIYSRLHRQIQESFFEAGVEIMSPHYSALRDGNSLSIPDESKPPGYQAPGFRVESQ